MGRVRTKSNLGGTRGGYGSTALALGRVAVGCSTTVGGTGASSTAAMGGAHSVVTAGSHCCAGVGGVFGASRRRSGVENAAHRAMLIKMKAHGWQQKQYHPSIPAICQPPTPKQTATPPKQRRKKKGKKGKR